MFNPFYEMVNVLGSLYIGQEQLKDDDILYLHADTLADRSIFEKMINTDADIVMPVDFKECDEEAMKVITKDGSVTEVSKLIPLDNADGEFIGMCKIKDRVIPDLKASANEKKAARSKIFLYNSARVRYHRCFGFIFIPGKFYISTG